MNILYVAQWAGAESLGMVYGHYYLAREWVGKGHNVTILAASYSHTRFKQPASGMFSITREVIDGITYIWIPVNRYSANSKLGRVISMFVFSIISFFYKVEKQLDVVISSSHHPFSIYAAGRMAKKNGAKLIFEVRDLWPESLIQLAGVSRNNPFVKLMAVAEKYAYKKSDFVVTTLEKSYAYMEEKGLPKNKFRYLPNGSYRGGDKSVALPEDLSQILNVDKFIVAYTGNIGVANNLDTLIDAGNELPSDRFLVLIVGDGPEVSKLKNRLVVGSAVLFYPRIEKALIPKVLHCSDISYLSYQNSPLYEYGISPTKLNDYSLSKTPSLIAADFDLGELGDKSFVFHCRDTKSTIKNEIVRLSQKKKSELISLGNEANEWVTSERGFDAISDKYLCYMTQL